MTINVVRLGLILLSIGLWAQDPAGVLEVRVRDAVSGGPIEGASVSARSIGRGNQRVLRSMKSDGTGMARFDGLAAGDYEVQIQHAGHLDSFYFGGPQWITRVGSAGEPARLNADLMPTGTLEGRVVDPDGRPLKGALIYAFRDNGPSLMVPSEADGVYRLEYIPPENVRLEIRVPYSLRRETARRDPDSGQWTGFPNVQFYPGVESADGAARIPISPGIVLRGFEIRLRKYPLTSLSGIAIDQNTQQVLVAGEVELVPSRGLADSTYDRRPLGQAGQYQFDLIRPGRYSLRFYRQRGETEPPFTIPVEVPDAGLTEFEAKVPGYSHVKGRVLAPEGKLLDWGPLEVQVFSPFNSQVTWQSRVSDDGWFDFDHLAPGTWRVGVSSAKPGVRPWYTGSIRFGRQEAREGWIEVLAGENAPLEIQLSGEAAQVSGTITGKDGEPVARGMVIAKRGGVVAAYQAAAVGDTFSIGGLAPGDYELTAVPMRDALGALGPSDRCASKAVRITLEASERRIVQLQFCGP